MPLKTKIKGSDSKARRRGNAGGQDNRQLVVKEAGQEYAEMIKSLGNGRFTGDCFDGTTRLCHIRGALHVRVNEGDIVLIGLRGFQDDKADILLKYSSDEARSLKMMGELADTVRFNEAATADEVESSFDFA